MLRDCLNPLKRQALHDSPAVTADRAWPGHILRRTVFVVFLTFVVYQVNPSVMHQVDALPAPYVAWNLIHRATFELTNFRPVLERHFGGVIVETPRGRWISTHPPGSAIMAVPFYAVVSVFHEEPPRYMLYVGRIVGAAYCALATGLIFLITHRLFPKSARLTTVLFGFGTTVYSSASQSLWQHGPAVFWVCLALVFLLLPAEELRLRRALWAGFALGMGTLCRPTVVILLPAFLAALVLSRNWRSVFGLALGSTAPIASLIAYNVHYAGNWLYGGLESVAKWTTPPWVGLTGLLVAPSRGLLFYTPALVVALWGALSLLVRRNERLQPIKPLLIGAAAGSVLTLFLYAKWWCWFGGWSYGPRLLTEIMPLAVLFFALGYQDLSSRWTRGTIAALVWLSVIVHAVGVFGHDNAWHARHYLPPDASDLFLLSDNQIWSSLVHLVSRVARLFSD